MARIAVIGAGHVGLVTAAGFARLGHDVTAVDVDPARIDGLRRGSVPFREAGLELALAAALAAGRLRYTLSYAEALEGVAAAFIAVDTPAGADGAPRLEQVRAAVHEIGRAAGSAPPLVVNKSTAPAGTADAIARTLGAGGGAKARVAVNPEFLREGHGLDDFLHPDRIVIGGARTEEIEAVAALYAGLTAPVIRTDRVTAELIKYAANAHLAMRVSFINEIAAICDRVGADVDAVVAGIGLDPRIGAQFMQPGIGYGGGCLPKDLAALRWSAGQLAVDTPLLGAVEAVNDAQRRLPLERLREALGGLEGRTVALLGITYKGNTDDVRDSSALAAAEHLLAAGATLRIYDPAAPAGAPARLRAAYVASPVAAATAADAIALLTDWAEFRDLPLAAMRAAMRGARPPFIDGRNQIDPAAARAAGFQYIGVGRGAGDPERSLAPAPAPRD